MLRLVKKKSKGNTLLLAIIVSMVLIITGVMVTTAVMNSTKLNINKRINNDLYYGAESGLEVGQNIIANQPTKVQDIMNAAGSFVTIKTINDFDTNVSSVEVKAKKVSDNKIQIQSISTKRGSSKTKTLTGDVNRGFGPNVSSLYQYSLASKELELVLSGGVDNDGDGIDDAGAFDFDVTKVGDETSLNLELWQNTSIVKELRKPAILSENITLNIPPMMTVPEAPKVPVPSPIPGNPMIMESQVSVDVGNGVEINEALDNKTLVDGVKIEFLEFNRGGYKDRLKIYIINADKLYINNTGAYTDAELKDAIVIAKGEVIVSQDKNKIDDYRRKTGGIRDTFSATTFKYNRATIISNKLSVYGGNFHCVYPLLIDHPTEYVNGILQSVDEVNKLNDKLEIAMPGWNLAGGGGGGGAGGWGMVGNIE